MKNNKLIRNLKTWQEELNECERLIETDQLENAITILEDINLELSIAKNFLKRYCDKQFKLDGEITIKEK